MTAPHPPHSHSPRQPLRREVVLPQLAGILESSALLDEHASELNAGGHLVEIHGNSGTGSVSEIIQPPDEGAPRRTITGGYSFGVTTSAQVLAAYGAELALKHLIGQDTSRAANHTHDLHALHQSLSEEKQQAIERHYAVRVARHSSTPDEEWTTAAATFKSASAAFVDSRYSAEPGKPVKLFPTKWLREATCSVLEAADVSIKWGPPVKVAFAILAAGDANIRDDRLRLDNVIHHIRTNRLPLQVPRISLAMTTLHKPKDVGRKLSMFVQCVDPTGPVKAFPPRAMTLGGDERVHHILTFDNLKFHNVGKHRFEIYADDVLIVSTPLSIITNDNTHGDTDDNATD